MSHVATTISIVSLLKKFSTEHKAVKWLERSIWHGKPICPHCGGIENITPSPKVFSYWHKDCRNVFTIKTNSVMHSSKVSMRNWAVAMYYLLTARKGISSMQLSKELGVTQKTAWFMLGRLREACKQGMGPFSGEVEIDETYIGGLEKNKHAHKKAKLGTGAIGKQAVMGLRVRNGAVMASVIDKVDQRTLQGIIGRQVVLGSTIYTDEHGAYRGLNAGYNHLTVSHSAKEFVNEMAHTNGIESVWALLKRGFTGTFHHWSMKHCQHYVDEFVFRLNQGNVRIDTLDRMASLASGITCKRLTYQQLIGRG